MTIWQKCIIQGLLGTSNCSVQVWITFLGNGRGTKEKVSTLLETYFFQTFPVFRAIEGHSGGTLVDATVQDNVLLLDDFAEYIYNNGNAHDMHSIIQTGLILGGKKSQSREPDVRQSRSGRSSIRSGQTTNYGVQKYLESSPKHSILVQSEDRSKKRIAVLSNTIPRNRSLCNTPPAICIEKVVYMKTGKDLCCKVNQSLRLPRAVLTPNLHHGRQDLPNPEARTSSDHQSE